ncbi:MAG TPA: methyltransferase domain-containing protein [Syntrophales bacterium]|nr:methyltransferase domain-containing protein [Syntrophales bacterium]HOP36072.1 methyltransferase domain-containing protein [Syntrophales bacterium]
MHQSSLDNMRSFRDRYLEPLREKPLTILDVGSMDINGSYRDLFDSPPWHYRGADMAEGKNVDLVLRDPHAWKEIPSRSLDVVISGQALEHMAFFWIVILEVERILRPGGFFCLIAPSGGPAHRYPVDCWRFLPDGFSALAAYADLEILDAYATSDRFPPYGDSSRAWNDTVVIGKKRQYSRLRRWKKATLRTLLHRLLILQVANREKKKTAPGEI